MVRIKLSELMGREKMNQKTLAKLTGIRPATISNMYYEDTKRIEIDQINSLCKVFHCTVGELLEYVPDESEKDQKLKTPLVLFLCSGRPYRFSQYFRSRLRYWTASATWAGWMSPPPSKSAMVRATFSTRS